MIRVGLRRYVTSTVQFGETRAAYLGARDPAYDHGWLDTGRWYTSFEGTGGIFVALAGW